MTDTNAPGGSGEHAPPAGAPAPIGQQPAGQQPAGPPPGFGTQPPDFGAQPPASPAPRRTLATGAIIGIVAGGVAVVATLAVVIAFAIVPGITRSKMESGGVPPSASDPADAVRRFMGALEKSDPDTALTYVERVSAKTYLTEKMVRASNKLAPLSHVTVGKSSQKNDYSAMVPVSYQLGNQKFRETLRLYKSVDEPWRLTDPTVSIPTDHFRPLGLTINGVKVSGKSVHVFPGAYELAVANPDFTIEGEATITVGFDSYPSLSGTEVALSEQGLATFRDIVSTAVEACVASPNLDAGCGITTPTRSDDGVTLVDGTLSRTLSAGASERLANLQPRQNYENPTVMEGDHIGSVDTVAQCQKGGQQAPCQILFGGTGIGRPSVDFSTTPATLRWDSFG